MKTTKRKVLAHLHVPPIPPDSGSARRSLGHLQYFKERSDYFEVDAIGCQLFKNSRWSLEQEKAVSKLVNNLYIYTTNTIDYVHSRSKSFYYQRLLKQQLPIGCDYYSPPGYVRFAKRLISANNYDLIWANGLATANWVCHSGLNEVKTFIDIHDIAVKNKLAMKNYGHRKGLKFDYDRNFREEIRLLEQYDAIVINSLDEITELKSHLVEHKLHWIPHIVENPEFDYSPAPYPNRQFTYDLMFIGSGNHMPNVEVINFFLDKVFPKIVYQKPHVKLAIAGTVCQFIQVDSSLCANVECLGFIDNPADVYLRSRVMLCPLLNGAGTKVKLQEAMVYGLPIVTTTVGASGLNLMNGINALITDDPDIYAEEVLRILDQPVLACELSTAINKTFEGDYSNTAVYTKLDHLFGIT